MIDLLITGIGGILGGGVGLTAGWIGRRLRGGRPGLRRLGALGGALGGGLIAMWLSMPPSTSEWLDMASPTLKAIHRYYPDTFAQLVASVEGPGFADPVVLQSKLRPVVGALIAAHRDELDDASTEALGRLLLDQTEALQQTSPEACVELLSGKPVSQDLRPAASTGAMRRDADVTARIIAQVATRPAPPAQRLSEAELQALSAHALGKLTNGEQEVVLNLLQQHRTPSTPREASAYCAFARARVSAAMDGQPGTLRRMLAS